MGPYALVVLAGGLVGFAIGRWWSLVAAVALGAVIASISEVDEVSPAALGIGYGVIAAAGIGGGVIARRAMSRRQAN
jgi:integral membrane sensor domain MASE1